MMDENQVKPAPEQQPEQQLAPKWVTAKLILGIISMVLFIVVLFQSCAVSVGDTFLGNGEAGGSFGILAAFNLLFSGIVAVAARRSTHKLPWIIAVVLLWLNYFFAKMFGGTFKDLTVWGFLSYLLGVFYLFSIPRTKKGYLIAAVVAAVYLIIALI